MSNRSLVIVPCGSAKVWDANPNHGPCPAKDAYTGVPFRLNREYAERFGDRWVILSAKYGFIDPDFLIPEPYEVTLKRKCTNPVRVETLLRQIPALGLDQFGTLIGLGGKEYRLAIEQTFSSRSITLRFPFTGLPIGKQLQAVRRALDGSQGIQADLSRY